MKNAFAIVTLSALLSACALTPPKMAPVAAADPVAPPVANPAEEAAPVVAEAESSEAPVDEHLPKVALTPALLYKLMKAELEFRNGNWQGPYVVMLAAAQQTRDPRLARRAVEMAISAKQGAQSLAAIRLWRELAPDSDEAAQYYLDFLILAGDIAEAEPIIRRKLEETSPARRGVAMFETQQFLARAKDKAAAAAMLERLMAPYDDSVEAHVVLAQAAYLRGAAPEAIAQAQRALAIKPDSEIAVLTLAQVTDDEAQITALLEKFLASNPQAREVRAAHARILVNRKQYEPARQEFLALLKSQPDNANTLYALGIMSMQLNDPAAAEKYFIRFTEVLKPNDERDPSRVYMLLSQLAEERKDVTTALQWLDKIDADESGGWFAAQLKRAQLMGKQGDVEGARKFLRTLKAEQSAEQVQVVLAEGQLLRDADRLADAYAVLEAGTKRFPANPDLLYDFALLAEKMGKLDVMEKSLREVIAQAPDNHHAYNALGYSLAERNERLDEARELIDRALKMAPDDPFIMDSMGWVLYRLGNLNEAENQLRQAYALRSDPEIAVHLGEVLWQKGLKSDAQKLWREARAKDPKNDTLRNTLARLHLSL